MKVVDKGLRAAIAAAGSETRLAARIGVSQQAVSLWQRIPAERIVDVERATKVPREKLRPDLFRRPSRSR
jgi:DNA-binding transcriptional regulator YdaS (Cro superfamily)